MARPKIKPSAKRVNITLTLPRHRITEAKIIAEMAGMSMSAMVELLLNDAFDRLKTRFDQDRKQQKSIEP